MDTTPQSAVTPPTPAAAPRTDERRTPYLPIVATALLLVGILAQFVDVLLAKTVFDVVVNQSEALSWLVSIGLTLTAAVLMMSVGISLRHGGRAYRAVAGVLLVAWLVLGLTLALVRTQEGSLLGGENEPADQVIAIVMLALYVAAGLDIALHSYVLHDVDREMALLALLRRRRIDHVRGPLLGLRARVIATLERWEQVIDELDAAYLDESAQISHHEAELKALARDRLTQGLADPARSSQVYRRPHEPQAAAAVADGRERASTSA